MRATAITYETLVGTPPCRPNEPIDYGNCFGVATEDGGQKIVNFYVENLRELLRLGLTWPIEIKPLSDQHAIIHDPRIGERWQGVL